MCFVRLLDRNVYNNDNSPLSFENTTGINTAACLCAPLSLDIFGMMLSIFAMHDILFDALHSASLENVFRFSLLYLSMSLATFFALSMISELQKLQKDFTLNSYNNTQQMFRVNSMPKSDLSR